MSFVKQAKELLSTYRRLLDGGEDTSGLHHVVHTGVAPLYVCGVSPVRKDRELDA